MEEKAKDKGNPTSDLVILVFGVLCLWILTHDNEITSFEQQVTSSIINFFSLANIIILIVAITTSSYVIYRIVNKRRKKIKEIKDEGDRIYGRKWSVERIFREYYSTPVVDHKEFLKRFEHELESITNSRGLKKEVNMLKKAIKEQKDWIAHFNEQKRLEQIQIEKEAEESRIRWEEREQARKKSKKQVKMKKILDKLNTYSNRVFERNNLYKTQIRALIEEGYRFVNEFSIVKKKRIPVLIKPFGNHSLSHAFLVWDAKRLLSSIKGVTRIREHLTREADITFVFNKQEYAIEIETGNLLGKHKQLNEKVNYLNKNYSKRWLFIVSHRDLVTKYKKFGLTSARNQVREKLSKLFKIAHT